MLKSYFIRGDFLFLGIKRLENWHKLNVFLISDHDYTKPILTTDTSDHLYASDAPNVPVSNTSPKTKTPKKGDSGPRSGCKIMKPRYSIDDEKKTGLKILQPKKAGRPAGVKSVPTWRKEQYCNFCKQNLSTRYVHL